MPGAHLLPVKNDGQSKLCRHRKTPLAASFPTRRSADGSQEGSITPVINAANNMCVADIAGSGDNEFDNQATGLRQLSAERWYASMPCDVGYPCGITAPAEQLRHLLYIKYFSGRYMAVEKQHFASRR